VPLGRNDGDTSQPLHELSTTPFLDRLVERDGELAAVDRDHVSLR
jgi:hypothetical protein